MKLSLSTNGYEVLETGSVMLYDAESDLKMNVDFEDGFSFKILFKFIKADKQNINKEVKDDTVIFKCYNFTNVFGTCTTKPVSLATVNNKEVFINFSVYSIGANNECRRLEYTFLEKA